ncbi:MAG: MFS transporter [Candidatus Tokpelaia sp. JSC161]|jgi:DHA1 family tetracycline resistance protein-like MFS transporter|nr:MAG: MFS transporter [Candidatus Tokpelaia sp. JSC161]
MIAIISSPRSLQRGLLLVFIALLLDIIGIAIITPIMPAFLKELTGDSISQASIDGGYLLMVYSIMQFAFAPLIGNLSDRFGRRPVLLVSILTLAIDNLICALASNYWILFSGRILAGISGASFSTCSAFIADISNDNNRTRNFGLIGIAFGVGFILGPTIGGLLGSHFGPRSPFYLASTLSLMNFTFSWFMLPETLQQEYRRPFDLKRANPLGALQQMRNYPSVLWVSFAFFCYWLAESAWPSIWPFLASYRYGWNESKVGLSLAMFGAGQIIVTTIILPYLTARDWSNRSLSITGLTFSIIGLISYAFAYKGWMIFAIFAVTCPEYLAHAPMRAIAASQVPPSAQGELQGALTSITSITSIIGPIIYTWSFAHLTTGAPYLLAALSVIISWLVMCFLTHTHNN